MKLGSFIALAALGLAVTACNKPADPATTADGKPTASTAQTPPPQGGSGGGVAPLGPNVGGMTPVSGSDSVEGAGGGGTGAAAKSMAKKAAAGAGAPAGMGQTAGGDTTGGE